MSDTVTRYCGQCDAFTDHEIEDEPMVLVIELVNSQGAREPARIGTEVVHCCVCRNRCPDPQRLYTSMQEAHSKVLKDSFARVSTALCAGWQTHVIESARRNLTLAIAAAVTFLGWFLAPARPSSLLCVAFAGLWWGWLLVRLFRATRPEAKVLDRIITDWMRETTESEHARAERIRAAIAALTAPDKTETAEGGAV